MTAKKPQKLTILWVVNKIKELLFRTDNLKNSDDYLRKLITEQNTRIKYLESEISRLEKLTEEYRQWEEVISNHVSSVDQKAIDIYDVNIKLITFLDVFLKLNEDEIEKAELIVKAKKHLEKILPTIRGKYDKGYLPSKKEKRWYDLEF